MLKRIYSTLPTFREIELHEGLNILLADMTDKSTKKDTRNGLGKTTFIEIINFLFGSSCNVHSLFRRDEFEQYYFIADYELNGKLITIKRRGKEHNKVFVSYNVKSVKDKTGEIVREYTLKEWNQLLGKELFNLTEGNMVVYNGLSYRSLIPYFLRSASTGGYLEAKNFFKSSRIFDTQISLTYLLGLDTNLAVKQKELETEKKEIKDLKKALKTRTYAKMTIENIDLRSETTILTEKASKLRSELDNYDVHPQYKELEIKASEYTKLISDLSNQNFIDNQNLIDIENSIVNEQKTTTINIEELYNEIEIKLPDLIINKYEEAKVFHEKIIQNRRINLESQKELHYSNIKARDEQIKEMTAEKSKLMRILGSHGALEQFNLLQMQLNELETTIKNYQKQLDLHQEILNKEANLAIDDQKLKLRISESLSENSEVTNKAILLVEEVSEELYETAARLKIGQTIKGRFDIDIDSRNKNSSGINSMLIFCFDMMLIQMSQFLNRRLDFLAHDSTLFDPVDERQVTEALLFAKKMTSEKKIQYIVTLNSDDVPTELSGQLSENILPIVLTDETEQGSLMGFYF